MCQNVLEPLRRLGEVRRALESTQSSSSHRQQRGEVGRVNSVDSHGAKAANEVLDVGVCAHNVDDALDLRSGLLVGHVVVRLCGNDACNDISGNRRDQHVVLGVCQREERS